jgi:hypothetical protein
MEAGGRHRVITGFLLFTVSLAIFLASPVEQISDSYYTCLISESLYKHGEVTLDRYMAAPLDPERYPGIVLDPPPDAFYRIGYPRQVEYRNGHVHYRYPLGSSFLSVPLVMAANASGLSAIASDGLYDKSGEHRMQRILAALLMAVFTFIAYLTTSQLLGPITSGALALAGALATPVWSTASRALWSHTWSVLLLGLVVWLLLREERTGRPTPPVLLGSLLAWSYFVRPTNAVSAVCVLAYLFLQRRPHAARVAATIVAWVAAFLVFTWLTRGGLLPYYYQGGRRRFVLLFSLVSNLFSPSRGLLIFCPWVPLVIAGALRSAGRGRSLAWLATVIVSLHLLAISMSPRWWGGYCYGPRFATEAMPWFVLLAALATKSWVDHGPGSVPQRGATLILAASLVGWSLFVHAVGALSHRAVSWNAWPQSVDRAPERLWDWAHPQFLAPFQHVDPPAGLAAAP